MVSKTEELILALWNNFVTKEVAIGGFECWAWGASAVPPSGIPLQKRAEDAPRATGGWPIVVMVKVVPLVEEEKREGDEFSSGHTEFK